MVYVPVVMTWVAFVLSVVVTLFASTEAIQGVLKWTVPLMAFCVACSCLYAWAMR